MIQPRRILSRRDDKMRFVSDDRRGLEGDARRSEERVDRRVRTRGGRRDGDAKKPWYVRRRLWLAAVSLVYVGWRRVTGRTSGA